MLRPLILMLPFTLLAGLGTAQEAPENPPAAESAESKEETPAIPVLHQSIVITATPVEPQIERRNGEVFRQTLFSRDDQVFHLVAAGIDAGQHEGGGKSIEVRRFGFNLDHGGVSGGLKVLVDGVQQNQTTQGHGQGYLGSLKTLSPELVQEVSVINGPFSAEYGDFSGLGVVHIRLRESLPDQWTVRMQGGSFGAFRGFLAWSPEVRDGDAFFAYDGSMTDGPFLEPLRYRRHNATANYTRRLSPSRSIGFKLNGGSNSFHSSGQLPMDEVAAGRLDPFGSLDRGGGGFGEAGTLGMYYRADLPSSATFRADAYLSRSLLDLYSNFTFYLNDPVRGDAFLQHDSRLVQGANAQYIRSLRIGAASGLLTTGANLHSNQVNVGLFPRTERTPTGITTWAQANVTNGGAYAQQSLSFLQGRLQAGAGIRYDVFRFAVRDRTGLGEGGTQVSGRAQPKFNLAATPSRRLPITLYANYGRGISSSDARGVVKSPGGLQVATTDFYQVGASHQLGRFSATADLFWIDRSNELVYVADDGSLEFTGPSRAYGYELKMSFEITRRLSLDGGMTKVLNAFYRETAPREYVERAPHFVGNAGLTLSGWRGWSGSLRFRAINHYRLDPEQAVSASGHSVFDLSMSRRIRRGVELSFAVDNLTDRLYFETQNWFESALRGQAPAYRIHATPGYPLTVTAGLTFRFRSK